MPWATVALNNWTDFVETAARAIGSADPSRTGYLFRGHAEATWPLVSSLARHLGTGVSEAQPLHVEMRIVRHFQGDAHLHVGDAGTPPKEDLLNWLALMQHHGAPTRFVDWTIRLS
jgi:hypothetical protein